MASRSKAREWETRRQPYHKKHGIRCFVSLPLSFRVLLRSVQPYFVPGCRFVPFKIAASLSLLAMTNLVGFSEKRNSFWNETIENRTISGTIRLKNDAKQHHAKRPHKAKTSVSKTKALQICVIARPQRGRGNLKVKGMASRNEARDRKTTKFPDFGLSRSDTEGAVAIFYYATAPEK